MHAVGRHISSILACFVAPAALAALTLAPRSAIGQPTMTRLSASDGGSGDNFGRSVVVRGDLAVVGAPSAGNDGQGVIYIFERQTNGWVQTARHSPSDLEAFDQFGYSVAIGSDFVAVGAPFHGQLSNGAIYIYEPLDGWIQTEKLATSSAPPPLSRGKRPSLSETGGLSPDALGSSLDAEGDVLVAGAPGYDTSIYDAGTVFVFERDDAGAWTQSQQLVAANPQAAGAFGASVSISTPYLVVGAPGFDGPSQDTGAAYTFEFEAGIWSERPLLIASDSTAFDRFGTAIALWKDRLVVGAPSARRDSLTTFSQGSAYYFEHVEGQWSENDILFGEEAAISSLFGSSVSMSGDRIVVGAPFDDVKGADDGSATIFERSDTGWSFLRLAPFDQCCDALFGSSVSLSGSQLLIGAPLADSASVERFDIGAAYYVGLPNRAPRFTQIADIDVAEGTKDSVLVRTFDPDGDPTLIFSQGQLPAFATFADNSDGTGILRVSPGFEDAGEYNIVLFAHDLSTGIAADTLQVRVSNVNRKPEPINPGDQRSREGDFVSMQLRASDPDEDSLTFDANSLPIGLSLDTLGLISGFVGFDAAALSPYSVTVTVTDKGEPPRDSTFLFLWTVDDVNPLNVQFASMADIRQPITVSAEISSDAAPASAQLKYRPTGEADFISIELARDGGVSYSAEIPPAAVTERGVDFFVRVQFGQTEFFFPSSDTLSRPGRIRVRFDQLGAPLELEPRQYRMVSVPAVLSEPSPSSVVGDDFGPADPLVWRVVHWLTDVSAYASFPDNPVPFVPGTASWIITAAGGPLDVGPGQSTDASSQQVIVLRHGWNQIGSPFAFPVAWSDVNQDEMVELPQVFDGSSFRPTSGLEPWQGYFVYNRRAQPVELTVPPTAGSVSVAQAAVDYGLQVTANFSTVSGEVSSSRVELGVATRDANSVHQQVSHPPPIRPTNGVRILENGNAFTRRLAPHNVGDGHRWQLELVKEGTPREDATVEIIFTETGYRPDGFMLAVIDPRAYNLIHPHENRFTLTLDQSESAVRLDVLIGTPTFIQTAQSEVVAPETTKLTSAYPSPTGDAATIGYHVSSPGMVTVQVFDILGRRVRSLIREEKDVGRYAVDWSTSDDSGSPVASGVYVVSMKHAGGTSNLTVVVVR